MTDPVVVLRALGRPATYAELLEHTTRRSLRTALAHGTVLRAARGRYCLPTTRADVQVALAAGSALSHLSAAVSYGWGVMREPDRTHITVPPTASHDGGPALATHWSRLSVDERSEGRTGPLRTVLDCARTLPVPEGLAVADSALRSGAVQAEELVHAAEMTRSPGADRARLVCRHADGRAANAFESGLRGHRVTAGITSFVPQLAIAHLGFFAVVDLGDPVARVALEADGHAVHGTRRAFAHDLRRHDDLQLEGWTTRRFAWEHVMFDGPWVVRQAISALKGRPQGRRIRRRTA